MSATTSRKQDVGSNGRGHPPNGTTQLSELVQRQIAEALEPIVDDLRDQMVETVRSQMEESLDPDQLRKMQQGGEQPKRNSQQGRKKQDRQGDDASDSPTQGAAQQPTSLARRLYQWLSEMVHKAINALGSWLSSMATEIRQHVIAFVGKALVSLLRPVLKAAIQKTFESVQQQGKEKLRSAGQTAAK